MQEEIENRTANLAISVTKLTARALISAYLKHRQHAKVRKEKVIRCGLCHTERSVRRKTKVYCLF